MEDCKKSKGKKYFRRGTVAFFVIAAFLIPRAKTEAKTFSERFNKNYAIEEAESVGESKSSKWWVNSGAWLTISGGTGKTVQGELPNGSTWQRNYAASNAEDTDNGLRPQNIFRLLTRSKWKNFKQQAFFRIKKINLSESDNRNESNGLLLFNRYQNSDNLYYTGLRVDGYAVIKKKIGGEYHTLSYDKVFGGLEYDRDSNPNLLPVGKWLGLRSKIATQKNGNVEIKLYFKNGRKAKKWKLVSRCLDKGQKGDVVTGSGYGGIRTDFMDVEFDDYKITTKF